MPEFVHLHNHTCYSLLDGLARIDDLIEAAIEHEMPALALTDHGTLFAAVEFYKRAQEANIKPIIGCEVYVADRPLSERPGPGAQNYHLVLLAENETGYRNLIELTTEAHLSGFYRKPRVDRALLEKHSDGLICLSACASSEVATRLIDGDIPGAEATADWYRQVFPDRYYLEVQDHELSFDRTINEGILQVSHRLGLPIVATNDVHYVRKRHAHAHEVLLCIQTQTTMADPKRMKMETEEFYLKSPEQMRALFGHIPGALSNSLAIAERCNLSLSFGRPQFPTVQLPEGRTAQQHLRALCEEGLSRRYPGESQDARRQLEYELSIIEGTGFVEYFLLVHDVIHFARRAGIGVGPGRGSAAGSIAAYCLFLTNVDPLAYSLSFERFLNPERVSMPDMDLDFADDRRDEVIRYVTEKYGRDRVAQIITFGTIGPRAGVRDVGRAMGVPIGDVDRVAKLVPFMCNKMSKAKEEVADLQQIYDQDEVMRQVMDTVEDLEGVARHASTHAAGVVIARDPLRQHVPLYKVPKNDAITTQYAMSSIEQIGLLKMDFLGLRTLTIMARACEHVRQATRRDITPDTIPIDDPAIYELLSSGETFGVFQVDGQGMRKFLKALRPTEFEHVIASNALYRPGPMQYIDEFAARKNGEREVKYDHPALEEVLKGTYGIVVYQEQVMKLAVLVAGYTMGEGDLLRRAMGKKKASELAKHREQFIQRAEERGTSREVAAHLFNVIEPFAGYAFNKAHSAAYAVLTCQTAYLKARYPREYLAGLLSAEKEDAEKVSSALAECRRLRISVFPPDINRSDVDFTLEEGGIRFGLSAIKHAGAAAIESILQERREHGEFASLEDFCARVDWGTVNKRVIESLARTGAFDSLEIERGRVVASLDRIVAFGAQLRKEAASNQVSLFGEIEQAQPVLQLAVAEPATLEERVAWEEELLGQPLSRHPVVDAESDFRAVGGIPVVEATAERHNQSLRVGGLIRGLRSRSTKAGQPMASFKLTDLSTTLECVVFSRSYEENQGKLADGTIVVVDGRVDAADGQLRVIVDKVLSLEQARDVAAPSGTKRGGRPVSSNGNGQGAATADAPPEPSGPPQHLILSVHRTDDRGADLERLEAIYAVLQQYRGIDQVEIHSVRGRYSQAIPLPNRTTRYCPQLEQALRSLVGEGLRLVEMHSAA